jgi:hypothetical protein
MRIARVVALAMMSVAGSAAAAQDPAASGDRRGALRVFLDCGFCDFDHLRTEMPWVEYVRDRTVADVHILGTSTETGAGGTQYTLNFLGVGLFAGRSDSLQLTSQPGETDDAVRSTVTRGIQLGLVPFVLRTPNGQRLRLSLADADDDDDEPMRRPGERDPWNAWVFEIGAEGSFDREEQQSDLQLESSLGARRITERWKIGFEVDAEFNRDRFSDEDEETGERITVIDRRENYSGGVIAVKSLGSHWALGAEAAASSSTFLNTQLALRAAPAIEYSVWPYAEATRRQLTLQYSAGISTFDYREETIYGRFSETRPTHTFIAGYDVRQPWGSADAELETAGFLDDFTQYHVEFGGEVDVRLVRGLELNVGASAALIKDQLALVKRGATPQEIFLRSRALRTDYRFDVFVGFSYTFGSIFNSIVNPRFGSGPGQILP